MISSEEKLAQIRLQAIEQRIYGDTYRHIGTYLDNSGLSPEQRGEIISEIKDLENSKMLKKQLPKGAKTAALTDGVMGALVVCLGLFLMRILWGKGFVALLPFFIIGYGVYNLGKSLMNR